jgi:cytochrome c551/c552
LPLVQAGWAKKYYHTKMLRILILVALLFVAAASAAAADPIDPHQVYEQKCARCHEDHARTFADTHLLVEDGRVVGLNRGRDLETFLDKGHGNLDPAEVIPLVAHLKSVTGAAGLYKDKCLMCHEPAKEFVRLNLIMDGDNIRGRYSKADIAEFMLHHGRINEIEHITIMDALKRQLLTQQ